MNQNEFIQQSFELTFLVLFLACFDLFSPVNTLHLKLECPAIQPPLLVTSGNGNNVLDFRQVYIGEIWFDLVEDMPLYPCILPLFNWKWLLEGDKIKQ